MGEVSMAITERPTLRFLTCGSVDDGKSTLIGRLLYDAQLVLDDQMSALEKDSKKVGTVEDDVDLALLVDGLQAEREQGITIDVAYRYFATPARRFIVADTPGHEQYTRNMATGASQSDLAIILIDARKGILPQTKRHSYIAHLLGIRSVTLAVNKMDLVDYSQSVFDQIEADYRDFAKDLGFDDIVAIPISALKGDNVMNAGAMDWYAGPTLMAHLETVDPDPRGANAASFAMPVQWVNRPNAGFRGYSGTVIGGRVTPGDELRVMPSEQPVRVDRIVTADGDLAAADRGQSVTLTLDREVDASRGDLLTAPAGDVVTADQFQAHVIWMSSTPMLPGRSYELKLGPSAAQATITSLRHAVNVNTLEHTASHQLELNEIGVCNIALDRTLAFAPYSNVRALGGFILIDRQTHETVAAGMIAHPLRRATNVHWQHIETSKAARAEAMRQKPRVVWFTGLSGSGKSTIANALERRLHHDGRHTYLLDGDNVRHGLNRDLGFTDVDRVENIRRVAEVSRLMVDAGLIVLVSFISPFVADRAMARELVADGEFVEVFVDTPLEVCQQRDPKGLYKRALAGEIPNFTGISSPYEPPTEPEVRIDTVNTSVEEAVEELIKVLR